MRKRLEACLMTPAYMNDTVITTAHLADDAGLFGAYAYAQLHHETN
jgi:hypothetical protein